MQHHVKASFCYKENLLFAMSQFLTEIKRIQYSASDFKMATPLRQLHVM